MASGKGRDGLGPYFPQNSARYRKSKQSSRRSFNFLRKVRNDKVTNTSEQEHPKVKEISKERKLLSNNGELAKALAESKARERIRSDEILKLQAEKLDLIEKLRCLKEYQEEYSSSALKSYQRNIVEKLVDATNVLSDLTVLCVESFGKHFEDRKEELDEMPCKMEMDCRIFEKDDAKSVDSTNKAIDERKREENADCPMDDEKSWNGTSESSENSLRDNSESKQKYIPPEQASLTRYETERSVGNKASERRNSESVSRQRGFEVISSVTYDVDKDDVIMIGDDSTPKRVRDMTDEYRNEEKGLVCEEIFADDGNKCKKEESEPIFMEASSSDTKWAEDNRKPETTCQKIMNVSCGNNENKVVSCLDEDRDTGKQLSDNKLSVKRKQRTSNLRVSRRNRIKRAAKDANDVTSLFLDDKENITPNVIQEMKQSNENNDTVYCSPFKKVLARMVASPLKTKSPIIMRASRIKRKVSYMEPSLAKKLRRGDPCTDSTLYASPHIGPRKRGRKKENRQPLSDIGNSITEED